MELETFALERGQSLWENRVEINLSESGVHPVSLDELGAMGLDLAELRAMPLVYVQTNGTLALREAIAALHPGADADQVEVTNGTSEANFLLAQVLLEPGDEVVFQVPNYLQLAGLARSLGAQVRTFRLRHEDGWRPDLEKLEAALGERTRLIYLSHPNNPSGYVLAEEEVEEIVRLAARVGAWIVADEVYRGSEHDGRLSPSFWGRYERVVVTSGLSKAYGIPGVRIGWIVGDRELVARCWSHHDYTTIAPGALSDHIARFAVSDGPRQKLWQRGRSYMGTNRVEFETWVASRGGGIEYLPPRAGAYAFVRYRAAVPSSELVERLRLEEDVLLVAGAWTGMEFYLRFGLGGLAEPFAEGLRRTGRVLDHYR